MTEQLGPLSNRMGRGQHTEKTLGRAVRHTQGRLVGITPLL